MSEISELKKEVQELKQITLLGSKRVLTMQDAVLLTGLSLSCLYKKTHKREIPFWKSSGGKLIYFNKEEIENWCLSHRVKTNAEIEAEAATFVVVGKRKKGGAK